MELTNCYNALSLNRSLYIHSCIFNCGRRNHISIICSRCVTGLQVDHGELSLIDTDSYDFRIFVIQGHLNLIL